MLTYPVGLITGMEIVLAGGDFEVANNFYLKSPVSWSLTPYNFYIGGSKEFAVAANGRMTSVNVEQARCLRPVISLKQGIGISSGTGLPTSPYIIK